MDSSGQHKVVGVLGGMGPYATLSFLQRLLSLTPAEKDSDHMRIVIDDNPHIPSRTRHLLYGEESPVEGMLESCLKLQGYGADFIALPCNSAAFFIPQMQSSLSIPILNICEATANEIAPRIRKGARVAALGGFVTYAKRTYKPFLEENGLELAVHSERLQQEVEKLILDIKVNPSAPGNIRKMKELIDSLTKEADVDGIALACTEFACLPCIELPRPVFDSSSALARLVVKLAYGVDAKTNAYGDVANA